MKKAIDDVTSGNMGFLLASKTYGVPKTTLERRVKNRNKTATDVVKKFGGIKCVFSEESTISIDLQPTWDPFTFHRCPKHLLRREKRLEGQGRQRS